MRIILRQYQIGCLCQRLICSSDDLWSNPFPFENTRDKMRNTISNLQTGCWVQIISCWTYLSLLKRTLHILRKDSVAYRWLMRTCYGFVGYHIAAFSHNTDVNNYTNTYILIIFCKQISLDVHDWISSQDLEPHIIYIKCKTEETSSQLEQTHLRYWARRTLYWD